MAKKKICGIYKITKIITDEVTGEKIFGKSYIGQSVDIEERFREHKRATEYSGVSLVSRAIKKYGVENFEFRILLECDKNGEVLDKFEIDCIKSYNTIFPNGYNIKSGGSQYTPPTEEQIKWYSEKNKGENNPMWGHSEERMGDKNPMFNRQHTDQAIKEIAARSHRGNHPKARKVADNLGNVWGCIRDCEESIGVSGHLVDMLLGDRPFVQRIQHLDLHYLDDTNWTPKSKEEIEFLIERNKTISHKELKRNLKLSGENNPNASKVESNDGRIWGTVKACAKELEITEGNLSGALMGKCSFNIKVRHLGLHYKL